MTGMDGAGNYNYQVSRKNITIDETVITFDFPIDNYLEIEGMLIVMLEIPVNVKYNENIFGIILTERKIKWQIEKRRYPFMYKQQCPFIDIIIYENKLRLTNWCSVYFIVDPLTGAILEKGETR